MLRILLIQVNIVIKITVQPLVWKWKIIADTQPLSPCRMRSQTRKGKNGILFLNIEFIFESYK